MAEIHVLDKHTAELIAAGEVVERPASVVKELLENSIDAGASQITVSIESGGVRLIEISDNGTGIEAKYIPTAFIRHATSKIRTEDDLTSIHTLGFRGEALASIASVARVEVLTRTEADECASLYRIEGGEEQPIEPGARGVGTTIRVCDLFFNTPARMKFLKKDSSEGTFVADIVGHVALSHPEVSFKFIREGKLQYVTPGDGQLRSAAYAVLGREFSRDLVEVDNQEGVYHIRGLITPPKSCRASRSMQHFYINGRYVRNRTIMAGMEMAFKGTMMQGKFPGGILLLEMPADLVDVNVHPTKMELRFSHQEEIYRQMRDMISDALNHREQIVKVSLSSDRERKAEEKAARKEQIVVPEPFEQKRQVKEGFARQSLPVEPVSSQSRRMPIFPEVERNGYRAAKTYVPVQQMTGMTREEEELFEPGAGNVPKTEDLSNADAIQHQQEPDAAPTVSSMPEESSSASASPEPEGQMQLFDEQFLTPEAEKSHRIIGQVFDTYWLIQYGENLYIIDQHAAHEKVLFERMMKNYREKNVTSQMVSPPLIVSLTPQEADLVTRYMDVFQSFGYEISPFGGKDYAINAVPHNLYGIATEELFIEILDNLEEVREKPLEILKDRLATMSCKAAVKGNNHLSYAEAEQLIAELLTLEDPYHCPHGRPTIISLSKRELEKKFKRIV